MSQYPSAPPTGVYAPPNHERSSQGFNPQQQQQYYAPQGSSPYPSSTPTYGAPAQSHQSHKPTAAFGQMLNQAVTTGKPMLNKIGKTISSKLGSKQSTPTPQHLESYQNYQQHQQQGQPQPYQAQSQQFNPQPQPQPGAYGPPQQSPFPQSNYGTPASGNSGQSNYFPQQNPQTPHSQALPQQPNASYNPNMFAQGGNVGGQHPGQPAPVQGPLQQGPADGQNQQSPSSAQFGQQQTGVIGASQTQHQYDNVQPAPVSNDLQSPSGGNQTQQWIPGTPVHTQGASTAPQQHPFNPASPPPSYHQPHPYSSAPPVPDQPTSAAPQHQPFQPTPPPPVPIHPNQQQHQQQHQQQQQWGPMSPVSSQAQIQNPIHPSVNTPPAVSSPQAEQQAPPNALSEPQHQQQPPTPAPQNPPQQPAPTEFVAELPADLGNLSPMESSNPQRPPSNPPSQGSQYQPYRPASGQNQSPSPGFTIARRAVSTSSLPLADPWRFADPVTELPTREFYIIADLLFDGMDRMFEPKNTGMLEACKLLASWKAQDLTEEAALPFSYDSYRGFAKLWSLEQIPHMMVPCEPSLMPLWNFQQQSHAQELKVPAAPAPSDATYPTYMPALNRAGWYKFLFLGMCYEPKDLEQSLNVVCPDTYKPGVLNQPDVRKRDKTPIPALEARATAVTKEAAARASREMLALMPAASAGGSQGQGSSTMTPEEMAVRMHSLKMQQQFNNMMVHTMVPGGIGFTGLNTGYGSLV